MKNYEQIRARNAIDAAETIGTGKEGGRAVAKKVPAMIQSNGFIGAMAFAIEAKEGYETVFTAIVKHLHDSKMDQGIAATDLKKFLAELCGKDASTLRAITAESMHYLAYLRRFAEPGKGKGKDSYNADDRAQ